MKKIIMLIFALLVVKSSNAQVPDSWTEKNGMGLSVSGNSYMTRRDGAVSFGIGTKLYIGTGGLGSVPQRDFWEYDPVSNVWVQKADFGGGQRILATAISIGSKGYVGTGQNPAQAYQKDFWEYDPATNSWTQKANFGGLARVGSCGFTISGKGYIGTGNVAPLTPINDFWEYEPSLNTWTQKANFAGTARTDAAAFSIGTKGYIGVGDTMTQSPPGNGFKKDFWEYDPALNTWTQKANFGGTARGQGVGLSLGSKGYIGLGQEEVTFHYKNDFWEYDPVANSWVQKANFGGLARVHATGCSVGTKAYISTGYDGDYKNDMWEYNPSVNSWTQKPVIEGKTRYLAISFSINSKGYVGTGYDLQPLKDFWEYDPITDSWTQKANFGGVARSDGIGFSIGNKGFAGLGWANLVSFNDFWEYDPVTNVWTQKANFSGNARYDAVGFSIGNKGYVGTGYSSVLKKDFWEYDPLTNTWTQKTDFGGTERYKAVGFSIGNKGYIGTGTDGTSKIDFWEYDPSVNTWTQKANFTGAARHEATGFSLGNKGYLGTGYFYSSSSFDRDFFEYDPVTNAWTQRADFSGSARMGATAFCVGNKAYMGTGYDSISKCDFWEYTPICSTPVSTIYSSGNLSFCNGDSVFLYANNGYNYQWKKNGVNITGATFYFYYAKTAGNYTCFLTNSCGSVTSTAISITVNSLPSAIITPSGPTTFCSGGSVILNAPVAANRTYQWKKGANIISGATLSSYAATTGGNYRVIVTNTITGCSKTTGSATVVTVNPLPSASITPQGTTTFCAGGSVVLSANTGAGLTYKWKKGSNYISGATLSNYTATTGGNYKVQVTNSTGCSKTSGNVAVSVPCKEGESISLSNNLDFTVYPNPNSGEFTINFSTKPTYPIQIEITDEIGKVVKKFETDNETIIIEESNLAKGIYCLVARNNNEVVIKKINIVK